jgi:Na+/H+-dicarboxylate symporter
MNKRLFLIHKNAVIAIIVSVLLCAFTGIVITLIFSPERIPISLERKNIEILMPISAQISEIIPKNLFTIFIKDNNVLAAIALFALLFGVNLGFDKIITKPVVQLMDSLNRIIYNLNSFIMEIMTPGMIFFSAFLSFTISSVKQIAVYKQLILILLTLSILLILIIFPAILYFMGFKHKPYKYLYGILGAAIAGFLSGNNYLANNVLIRHCHENLKVSRPGASISITLFSIFGRAGTTLVSSVCFIIIIRSYSDIEITFLQILYIAFLIIVTSFALSSVPGSGVLILLTTVCTIYGHGIEDGYLMFKPIMPLLLSFAVLIDVITTGICSLIIADMSNERKGDADIKDFI